MRSWNLKPNYCDPIKLNLAGVRSACLNTPIAVQQGLL